MNYFYYLGYIFSGSKYLKNVLRDFENRSTGALLCQPPVVFVFDLKFNLVGTFWSCIWIVLSLTNTKGFLDVPADRYKARERRRRMPLQNNLAVLLRQPPVSGFNFGSYTLVSSPRNPSFFTMETCIHWIKYPKSILFKLEQMISVNHQWYCFQTRIQYAWDCLRL